MKKLVLVVLGLIGVVFVCLILAAVLLPSVDVSEPEYVAEVAPRPTARPTARPKPTAIPATCLTVEEFERLGAMVFTVEPYFVPGKSYDQDWQFVHANGAYGISIDVDRNGCITNAIAAGVFDADYGDYNMLGELIGGMAGYLSWADDELDWLFNETYGEMYNCITYTDYDAHKAMSDGTDWYLYCMIDADNDMNIGVRIDL